MVMLTWLLGWFIKARFFVDYLFIHFVKYPILHALFPKFFLNPYVAQFFYFFPVVVLSCFFSSKKADYKLISVLMMVCSAILCWHINTYNDATFVTSFWVALWLFWFSCHGDHEGQQFYLHACVLAQCIVGMIFLGGLVGKLTPEYYSGEAIYNIFIKDRMYWPFSLIREIFSLPQQHSLAMLASRVIILGEAILALAAVCPLPFVCVVFVWMVVGLVIFCTWMILSVLLCLLGMLLACLWLRRKTFQDYSRSLNIS